MRKIITLFTLLIIAFFSQISIAQQAPSLDNIIVIKLQEGDIVIQLYPDKAPEHVKRIKELAKEGFYNGVTFHRVIDGFMVQTGDPTGTGMGSSNKPNLKAEFNDIKHIRGVVSMARSDDPNSANSQFFIMLGSAPSLDGKYTAFGRVIKGMDVVDKIKKGDINNNGKVIDPTKIISIQVASDMPGFKLDIPQQISATPSAENAPTAPTGIPMSNTPTAPATAPKQPTAVLNIQPSTTPNLPQAPAMPQMPTTSETQPPPSTSTK